MLTPIPFTWPLGAVFLPVLVSAYRPSRESCESLGVRSAARDRAARDPSYRPLVMGQQIVISSPSSGIRGATLAMRGHRERCSSFGLVVVVAASLFRRHCFRMLGADFRGDVTVRADQPVIDRGAYRYLRHPSYLAAISSTSAWASASPLGHAGGTRSGYSATLRLSDSSGGASPRRANRRSVRLIQRSHEAPHSRTLVAIGSPLTPMRESPRCAGHGIRERASPARLTGYPMDARR